MIKRTGSFIITCVALVLTVLFLPSNVVKAETPDLVYLSDYEPISQSIGYGSLYVDKGVDGGEISLIVDGERTYFPKGFVAHAKSTVVYDIGENHGYDYFDCYIGVDAIQQGKGDVLVTFSTSSDNVNWTDVIKLQRITSADEAIHVNISVDNVRYIKFYFDTNGVNYNDHSGVANPVLYKSGCYPDASIPNIDSLNEDLKGESYTEILENSSLRLKALQRMFLEKVGYFNLASGFLNGDKKAEHQEMFSWLYNDVTALEDFVMGGDPVGGSYANALDILSDLYKEYKDDLSDTTALFEPEAGSARTRADLYRTMMISIALTHADGGPHSWLDNVCTSDPIERYSVFKKTYTEGLLRNDVYENLTVEEMRWVMQGKIHNDEIYWLNNYVRLKTPTGTYPGIYSPHRFLRYGKDWDYTGKGYKLEENFSTYDSKYSLVKYGLNFSEYNHLWMVFEGSHICWGISYAGTNFANAFGVPSHYVRQSGHAAFFVYNKNSSNQTTWSIDNNISGWTATWMVEDVVGYANNRMMLDWGTVNNGWSSWNNATYVVLASTAMDNYEDYVDAEILLSLETLPSISSEEEVYNKALEEMPYNLDAWKKLVDYYIDSTNGKSDEELANLEERICSEMYFFPLPMHDLTSLIKTELKNRNTQSSLTQLAKVNKLEIEALQKGKNIASDPAKSLLAQPDICSTEANYLLDGSTGAFVTFSFDGVNENCLVFGSDYKNVRFRYSLDGGENWSETHLTSDDSLAYKLSDEEIGKITADNDILIWLEGWTSSLPENAPEASGAYCIDITEGTAPSNIELNDNENRFLGTYSGCEYSTDNGTTWNDLSTDVAFEGEASVLVRKKAYGTVLTGTSMSYEFTDNYVEERAYIQISRLTYVDCSSEQLSKGDDACHVIDGLTSTRWHTYWWETDNERYVTIELDEPVYLNGLDYLPPGANQNGLCYSANILVSLDGEHFENAYTVTGWSGDASKKHATFEPVLTKYVRFQGVSTVGNYCSAKLIELFEDNTLSKDITGIQVTELPKKTEYFENNAFSTSGMRVDACLGDGEKVRIPIAALTISDVDTSTAGEKTVNVSYGVYTTSFSISVLEMKDCTWLVGASGYDDLSELISCEDLSENPTIYLMKDIELSSPIVVNDTLTIDGNNHRISRAKEEGTDNLKDISLFEVKGNLTLSNIILDGGANYCEGNLNDTLGRYEYADSKTTVGNPLISCTKNGMSLTLGEGTVLCNNADKNYGSAVFAQCSGNVTLNGCRIENCYAGNWGSAILMFRDSSGNCGNLTINNAAIEKCNCASGSKGSVICADIKSALTINDITMKDNIGGTDGVIWISNGTVTINGGTFENNTATVGKTLYVNGSANVTIHNFDKMEEIYLASGRTVTFAGNIENSNVNITSAVSENGTTVAYYSCDNVYELLLALNYEGKMLVADSDTNSIKISDTAAAAVYHKRLNKITYYENFMNAFEVSTDDDEITLLKDVELSDDLVVNKQIKINTNSNSFIGANLVAEQGYETTEEEGKIIYKLHKHVYTQPEYVWTDDMDKCYVSTCCNCGDCCEEYGVITSAIKQSYSCLNDEITTYTAAFRNENFTTQTVDIVTREAQGHNLDHCAYKEATYTEDGNIAYDYCRNCDTYFVNGNEVSSESIIIPKKEKNTVKTTDFTVTVSDVIYDGKPKEAIVSTVLKSGTEIESYEVSYYNGETKLDAPPVNAGTYTVKISVTENEQSSYKSADGLTDSSWSFTVGKKTVSLTSGSGSKVYDGKALTVDTLVADGFAEGEGLESYTVTGSETAAGSSANTFTYVLKSNTDAANYDITVKEGTLTVEKKCVTLSSGSGSKTYDGQVLTVNTVTAEGFAEGEGVENYSVTGTITSAGSSANTFIYTLKSNTNADNYEITVKEGTLTIGKRTATLTSGSGSKTYDGKALTVNTVTAEGFAEGEGLESYNVTGSITETGSINNTFTYALKSNTSADNYDITVVEGTLTVKKASERKYMQEEPQQKETETEVTDDEENTGEEHVLTHIEFKEASCKQEGVLEHDHCEKCGKDFIEGIEVESASLVIEKKEHSLANTKAEKKLFKTLYICPECGEILKEEKNIIPLILISGSAILAGYILFAKLMKRKKQA